MKKYIVSLSIAALVLSAGPALAKDNGNDGGHGFKFGKFFSGIFAKFEHKIPATDFVLNGTVVSTGTNSLVVNVGLSANIKTLTNGQSTIGTDSSTKIFGAKNATETLADLKAGDRVEVIGTLSGTTLVATNIHDSGPAPVAPVTLSGKVSTVSATSITLNNAIAGTSQVFVVDAGTKVNIDGVTKAVADIQVGDAGTIKSKTSGTTFTASMITLFR